MRTRTIAIVAGIAIAVLAAATYASPHWQLVRLRAAVEARDAQALARHVNFPRLRQSVKVELMRRLGAGALMAEPGSNPFAAIGKTVALAVIDPVVDAAVSPAGVAAMLDAGDIRLQPRREEAPAPGAEGVRGKPNYDLSYRSWNQVVVERADGGGMRFVLDRDGLWRWKLVGVELRDE